MIVIPRRIIKRISAHNEIVRHYELLEDKCTKYLAVYRCLETGHTESFQKKDFEEKKHEKERDSKWE